MIRNRRLVLAAAVLVALSACRGGAGPSSVLPAAQAPQRPHTTANVASVTFTPIGPLHMTSGGLPNSGKVNAYAVDPTHATTIYVASGRGTGLETYSSAGLFRTTDGGASWQPVMNGLVDASGMTSSVVNALWLDPAHPNVLLAATEYDGIYRTTSGGAAWRSVYPATPSTQIVSYGGTLFAATAAGILASGDDGAHWNVALAASATQWPTAFGATEGSSGSALYAGMSNGTIYRYAANAWTKTGTLPYETPTGTDGSTPAVHQMAVDPLTPLTVYASSNDGHWDQDLHASIDGGHTWNVVLKGKYGKYGLGTQAIAFSIVHPHRLYVGADGGMYYITGDGSAQPSIGQAANLSVIDVRNVWTSANGADDACWIASDQGLDYEP